jgi:hypothetical protein
MEFTEESGGVVLMASEWVGVVGTLAGTVLGAVSTYLIQTAQWRRQDRLNRQADMEAAVEEFLRQLQPCRRRLERVSPAYPDREEAVKFMRSQRASWEIQLSPLLGTLPRLELYATPAVARLGTQIANLFTTEIDKKTPHEMLELIDPLEESLQLEIESARTRLNEK